MHWRTSLHRQLIESRELFGELLFRLLYDPKKTYTCQFFDSLMGSGEGVKLTRATRNIVIYKALITTAIFRQSVGNSSSSFTGSGTFSKAISGLRGTSTADVFESFGVSLVAMLKIEYR